MTLPASVIFTFTNFLFSIIIFISKIFLLSNLSLTLNNNNILSYLIRYWMIDYIRFLKICAWNVNFYGINIKLYINILFLINIYIYIYIYIHKFIFKKCKSIKREMQMIDICMCLFCCVYSERTNYANEMFPNE